MVCIDVNTEPKLIRTWEELSKCESETHILDINVDMCCGWIRSKKVTEVGKDYFKHNHYLSTHTFYGSNYEQSTKLLQECGFNIRLANWDEGNY